MSCVHETLRHIPTERMLPFPGCASSPETALRRTNAWTSGWQNAPSKDQPWHEKTNLGMQRIERFHVVHPFRRNNTLAQRRHAEVDHGLIKSIPAKPARLTRLAHNTYSSCHIFHFVHQVFRKRNRTGPPRGNRIQHVERLGIPLIDKIHLQTLCLHIQQLRPDSGWSPMAET